jgi:subtilisin family serine protease
MRILLTLLACLGLITLALLEFPSGSHAFQTPSARLAAAKKRMRQEYKPGEVLVRYRSESMARARVGRTVVTAPTGDLVTADVERFDGADLVPGLRLVRVAPEQTLEAVAAFRRQPDVLYAEPNYILHADVVPNDPFFSPVQQYGLAKIGAQNVWDNFTTGSSSIVVAVVDQGIETTHPDLTANIWTNPSPNSLQGELGISGDVNGYNFDNNSGVLFSGSEEESHATHVAGILGATGNNSVGVTGVNWSVRLMSLKFLDNFGSGDTANAVRACTYAKRMRELWDAQPGVKGANVRVINASFGGDKFTQTFLDAVVGLNNAGILFVAAAGNVDNGSLQANNDLIPHFPSSFDAPNVIAVAATNQTDTLTSFSHFGKASVDLGAPGFEILSTTPPCQHPGPFPDFPCEPSFPVGFGPTTDTYSFFDGTSMSAPFVSGAAALLWAHNPNLTVQQVKSLLLLNGDVQAALVDKTLTGRRLNIANSFQSLQTADNTAPGAVTNFHLNFQNGRTFNIGWNASGDDGASGTASLYELSFIDGGSGAVIPLRGVLPAAPGTAQTTQVTIPYRHTSGTLRLREFDNKGNEGTPVNISITISPLEGDPYTTNVGASAALTSGGTRLPLVGDDRYNEFLLPSGFSVPFFGTNFTEVTVSSNGNLFFSDPPLRQNLEPGDPDVADDPPGSRHDLGGYQMIAGFWEDLTLDTSLRADAGVYVTQLSPSRMVFRWQAVPCNFSFTTFQCTGGGPVNFEIELRTDGVIKTRYGSGNSQLRPTVGISGGDQDAYYIPSHTGEDEKITLNNAGEVTFTPIAQFSPAPLTGPQVELKNWQNEGRTFIHAKLTFPDGGFRVADWGTATRAGNVFTTNATIEHFNGTSAQAISSTAQIWDLGALVPGAYQFVFKNAGATVKTLDFNVSNTAPPPNPIDDARTFVRWQYKDFLRREPDGPGWDHWTFEITQCSDPAFRRPGETEAQCTERKRENTSAAFFVSPESQNIAYFVLRVYRGSLGRMPFFGGGFGPNDEFTRDAATVGTGIVVNNALDHNVINSNKQAFVNAFVTRSDFRAIFDGLNNTQYVDRLFQTTGVTPSSTDRQALINGLNASTETRASVLFKVVDGTTTTAGGILVFNNTYGKAFYDNLFNAAFVQMEYFGYLQRDPDPGGYAFWLGKLNTFGDWVNAEMVKSFIKAPEYRARFGAP